MLVLRNRLFGGHLVGVIGLAGGGFVAPNGVHLAAEEEVVVSKW
jgi:hypothetical protein